MSYDITIRIDEVETNNLNQLKDLCEMLVAICNTVCRKCDYNIVKRYGLADYEMKEVKE